MTTQVLRNPDHQKTKPPKKWGVLLLNDDYTTMDFVVMVLQEVFGLEQERAVAIMLRVHHQGRALCGVYTCEVAQVKQKQVLSLAQQAGFPLMCVVEEI